MRFVELPYSGYSVRAGCRGTCNKLALLFTFFLVEAWTPIHARTKITKYTRICAPLPIISYFLLFGDGSIRENVRRVGGPLMYSRRNWMAIAAVDPMETVVRRYMRCLNPEN